MLQVVELKNIDELNQWLKANGYKKVYNVKITEGKFYVIYDPFKERWV